jgi:hypothetical protein
MLFFLFIYFIFINQLRGQYTGGSSDGFDLYTSEYSTLNGSSYAKYAGGSYDGYTFLSGLITQLDGQQTSEIKCTGGNYDGYIVLTGVITQLDGQQTSIVKYTGGSNDGYEFIVSGSIYLDGKEYMFQAYLGGSNDGYALAQSQTDVSLPVTLSLFALEEIPDQTAVKIEWQTESEIENAYWLLLRRMEEDSVFATLQKVEGQGNSSVNSEYNYQDSDVEAGLNYTYQLADVSISGQITYHEEKSIAVSIPKSFELFQNYPNPFNPNTNIKFALPAPAKVQLKIYNILGQQVIGLLDQLKKAGYHTVEWNGSDRFGNQISSGMYIYLMQAQGVSEGKDEQFQKARRMILVK